MFKLFNKNKTIPFSEVLDQMSDKIITNKSQCHFFSDRYGEIHDWQLDMKFYSGDKMKVIEFYKINNIIYRNSFDHVINNN